MNRKQKVIAISIFSLVLILIMAIVLNATHVWKNNQYRFLHGKHLHLKSEGKELFWFDVSHSNNPDDVMFRLLENEFDSFSPDLVLVEGGANSFEGTRDEAVLEGENSFGAYLAKTANIPVEDIEPPFIKQIEYLQNKYASEDIFAMYALRQIGSMELMPEDISINFDEFALDEIQYLTNEGLLYEGKTSDDVLITLNKYLPEPMNRDNWLNLNVYRVYAKEKGVVNDVYLDVVEYRNIHLVELIQERSLTYNRILIVMGGQHLLDTKEELQKIYPR